MNGVSDCKIRKWSSVTVHMARWIVERFLDTQDIWIPRDHLISRDTINNIEIHQTTDL